MKGNSPLFDYLSNNENISGGDTGSSKSANIAMSKPKTTNPFDTSVTKTLEFNKSGYAGEKSKNVYGKERKDNNIRMINGGKTTARNYFAGLISKYPGTEEIIVKPNGQIVYLYRCRGGGTFTYRERSKFGPPTIDINNHPKIKDQKIKFKNRRK